MQVSKRFSGVVLKSGELEGRVGWKRMAVGKVEDMKLRIIFLVFSRC